MIAYAITDPSTLSFDTLSSDLQRIKAKGATMILYRDKGAEDYDERAVAFVSAAREAGFERILLHNRPELALALGAQGVHLSSDRMDLLSKIGRMPLLSVVSTHHLSEALKAQESGASIVTLSPLYASPGKGTPLGEKRFEEIVRQLSIPVIALGGILGGQEIDQAMALGAAGFASIRYFSR
ncbi:thiamine phosphate synthase [Nitratifractor sp.]|uniref:thiamine phosphate synthase n=1 Tax=Nitratifractor sp. TaxID=2268144 RepID=UPI0025D5D5CD|nr:thiamine phosphate synthase [Nitratifractor sp.]